MKDLLTWLRAQLQEDEGLARTAFAEHNDGGAEWHEPWSGAVDIGGSEDVVLCNDSGVSRHIVNWDPARALAEVDAKRQLLDCLVGATNRGTSRLVANEEPWAISGDQLVKMLALPYAGRAGYLEEWRP